VTGSRISDMTVLGALPASAAFVPIVETGIQINYRYDLAADLAGRPTSALLAAAGGAALIGVATGGTVQSKLFGTDLGAIADGVNSDLIVSRSFSGVGSSSGLYGENNQIRGYGTGAIGSIRAVYFGTNVDTTSGTTDLAESAHFFTWVKNNGNVTIAKVVEAHLVAGRDDNAVNKSGTITTEGIYFNCAGITLGTTITIPKVTGFNAGQLTQGTQVTNAYGFNAEHNAAATETVGYRSQQRSVTGAWSFLANTNDGSAAAPAGFSGSVAIGANTNGAAPVAPTNTLTVTSLNSDYAGLVNNRHPSDPFGLRIRYTAVSPADAGHDFIHCDANGTTYFQVASNGKISIAGTQVLGPRQTGWTAATGTATRSTFATASVTTAQLAEHVKALIDDLISHGVIGA
jgi:hypothetical protein